jgi:hypothetical protein
MTTTTGTPVQTVVAPGTKPAGAPIQPVNKPNVSPSASPPIKPITPPPFRIGPQTGGVDPQYLKGLFYGQPGAGKTTLVLGAADVETMRDVLWVDCENSDLIATDNDRIKDGIHLLENRVQATTFEQVSKVHDWLKGHCIARDAKNTKALIENEARLRGLTTAEITEPKMYRTVILDSLSEINQMSNQELLGVDEAKVLAGDSDDIQVATWDEFRKNNMRIQMLCRAFRNLPMNFLATAGVQYKQDDQKKMFHEPALTGQLARQVLGVFDIVGFFRTYRQGDKVERRVYVQPVENFYAKNRRSVFKKDYFIDPTMLSMMADIGLVK